MAAVNEVSPGRLDTSTDHPSRIRANEADAALRDRLRTASVAVAAARPPVMRSDVSDADGAVRIVLPMPRLHPLAMIGGLFPSVVAMGMLGWLGLFSSHRTLMPIEWVFIGLLFLGFGFLPLSSVVGRWLRSRVGRTIVTVSSQELRVQERGIFGTRTVAELNASEILDVDYSTKASLMVASRRHAEEETATMRRIPMSSATGSVGTERVLTALSWFLKGKGIIVKTRTGLTTFGEGLADDEIQYLHALVRRALAGTSG
jgi:hypothetical protein